MRHPGGWLGEDIDYLYDFINSGDPERRAVCNALMSRRRVRRAIAIACTGDYNAFWAERDLLPKVKNIKAAVLMAHAFNDWNVVPEHSVRIYEALKGRVPLMAYYHQGGHGGDPPMEMMNKWFTRYLYGVENGVEKEPQGVDRARRRRRAPPPAPAQAAAGRRPRSRPRGDASADAVRGLSESGGVAGHVCAWRQGGGRAGIARADCAGKQGTETFIDNVELDGAALALAESSAASVDLRHRRTDRAGALSGTARVTIRLASSKPAANLSVYLVQLPWTEGADGTANLITRGWADPQNAASLKSGGDYHAMKRGVPLPPGKFLR